MILVPTRVAASGIHGNGLFAAVDLPRGTPFYRFLPGFDQAISPEAWAALPEPARGFTRHFTYFDRATNRMILSGDDARFMNHSETPNTGILAGTVFPPGAEIITVVLRDVPAGGELTCDYRSFDGDVAWKLGAVLATAPLGSHPEIKAP
jgi:SET domain-containing protein